jgi:hypothetical protein
MHSVLFILRPIAEQTARCVHTAVNASLAWLIMQCQVEGLQGASGAQAHMVQVRVPPRR